MDTVLQHLRNNIPALLFLLVVVYLSLALNRLNHEVCNAAEEDRSRFENLRMLVTLALLVSFVMLTRTAGGLFGKVSETLLGDAHHDKTSNLIMTSLLIVLLGSITYLSSNVESESLLLKWWVPLVLVVLSVASSGYSLMSQKHEQDRSAFSYKY